MTRAVVLPDTRWFTSLDRDIDRLIDGINPQDPELAELMALISELRDLGQAPLPETFITDHAAVACSAVATSNSSRNPVPSTRVAHFAAALRRRLAAAATGLAMFAGISGVALASDGAIPGEWNYPIDQTMEVLGIGAGGYEERLSELYQMTLEGSAVRALHLAAQLLDGQDAAVIAIAEAADRLASGPARSETPQDVLDEVATLLEYLMENRGAIDGQVVSKLAQDIGNGPPTEPPGNGDGVGNGPPTEPPGNGNGNGVGNGNGPPAEPPGNGNGPPDK